MQLCNDSLTSVIGIILLIFELSSTILPYDMVSGISVRSLYFTSIDNNPLTSTIPVLTTLYVPVGALLSHNDTDAFTPSSIFVIDPISVKVNVC